MGCVIYNCCWLLPSLSFSGPRPAGLTTIFYCVRFETLPTWRARFPYLYPPGTGWSTYTPRHWFPFPSPPTTRKATVELLESDTFQVKIKVILRLAVYCQSVLLGEKPLETHDQNFYFPTNHLRSQSLCNTLSNEKMGLSLMNMLGHLSTVRIAHIACYWKFILLHYIQILFQYRPGRADHDYFTYLMLQRQLSRLNGRKLDHRQVYILYIFYVLIRLVLYRERVFSWFRMTSVCNLHNFVT
jgi:hypothetical protein